MSNVNLHCPVNILQSEHESLLRQTICAHMNRTGTHVILQKANVSKYCLLILKKNANIWNIAQITLCIARPIICLAPLQMTYSEGY